MSSNEAAFVSGLGASGLRSGLIHRLRWSAGRTIWPLTALACAVVALSAGSVDAQVVPDLVSRTALRVCADPANMPFSDRSKQGFENKIADIVADQLKEPVRYLWAPSGPGFSRNTLNADLCDIVMGYAVGSDVMQSTNPYYRSTYVIVAPKGSALAGVEGLDDPKLKGHTIGVFSATPPVDIMLKKGLMEKAAVYPILVDHRFDSPLTKMVGDLTSGRIDAAVVWGPLVGLDVKKSNGALILSPLVKDVDKPGFSYRISFGIRHDEPDWKHKLEAVERARAADIGKVLVDYAVPMIDDAGQLIAPADALKGAAVSSDAEPARHGRAKAASSDFKMPGPAPVATPQTFKMPSPAPSNAPPP